MLYGNGSGNSWDGRVQFPGVGLSIGGQRGQTQPMFGGQPMLPAFGRDEVEQPNPTGGGSAAWDWLKGNADAVQGIAGVGAQIYGLRQQGRMDDRRLKMEEEDRRRRIEHEERIRNAQQTALGNIMSRKGEW